MGSSHAISGAAAWVAVTATAVPALGLYPLAPSAVLLGALVAAGAALLPDADHHNATIAHSVPVLGKVAAGAVETLSGGHRHGMHSLLALVGVITATIGLSFVQWTPQGWDHPLQFGSAAAVAACTAFAVKVLTLVKSWSTAWLVGALAAAAVLASGPHAVSWLPVCIGVGFVAHLIGDVLTVEGVPILWPLRWRAPRFVRGLPIVSQVWKANGSFAIPILGHAGSKREWLLTLPLACYALWGLGASALVVYGPI
ncbi:metal-dependent hydrolase [Microbacterium sp. BWT-B31]|uniref:metal-dependent hydrolase n=1 Tax=Microbacterium sp. BWT-B31 TaxID=3232072 RepID=UPI0035286D79